MGRKKREEITLDCFQMPRAQETSRGYCNRRSVETGSDPGVVAGDKVALAALSLLTYQMLWAPEDGPRCLDYLEGLRIPASRR